MSGKFGLDSQIILVIKRKIKRELKKYFEMNNHVSRRSPRPSPSVKIHEKTLMGLSE